MVYLSRIYTRTGDDGGTALGDGQRVRKDAPRVEAMGAVDELNAALGVLLAQAPDLNESPLIRAIQNDLFDLGADLCVPLDPDEAPGARLRTTPEQVARLEQAIDRLNEPLAPLTSFILPGGTLAAAHCHLARTLCRRAERALVALMAHDALNPQVLVYLNRLSDLLFVLARAANGQGQHDILWVPGQSRARDPDSREAQDRPRG